MKTRTRLAIMLLALAAPLVQAADNVTLRLGDVKGDRLVALKASGELENLPYHLQVSSFDSGAPVQEALNAGALDVGFTGDLPFLYVYAAGAPVKAVGAWQNNPDSIALLSRPGSGIDSLAALKGKRIAVNRGGWGHYLVLGLLKRAGLKPSDVTLRFLGPADGRAALSSGSVDAWAPWEPYLSSALILDHAQRVPDGGGKGIMSGYSFVLAREDAIHSDKRAAISDLLTRLARAQRWALLHPQQFSAALATELHMPRSVTEAWTDSARVTPVVFTSRVQQALQHSADVFFQEKVLPRHVDVSNAFDYSLATAANNIAATPLTPVKEQP
ncbi:MULTISPECIES: ABC transporter substrate-binding protein [Tatumella]|uniref:ABC transporter substrate-binding protein n=1 Tax=Tatumella punctata TaxID=399969 RepID=A0ABW1VKA9_9GAMM|nr:MULTISPECIES: ABC transporter substrate-binding protein [unclassified Tatumella]MBS0878922.1 ABC transporter substrate-binding protein [Tatumella sp. JGM82]MBS0891890.1 ABC transporter substrate-binding protein [Tatumella sp. JGM94]MBS0895457.1 ABC transporter substrate-binding protein [Tatumella sp. JGM130]MBS0902708.1 ABC transporter substrate-binding protein [Tatumella sp. JGM100]